jgi:isochorismate hydrolase
MNELKWGAEGRTSGELEVDGRRDHEVVKCRYSAFVSGSSIWRRPSHPGTRHLIMTGVATNVCVGSAMDAMMLDFKVTSGDVMAL